MNKGGIKLEKEMEECHCGDCACDHEEHACECEECTCNQEEHTCEECTCEQDCSCEGESSGEQRDVKKEKKDKKDKQKKKIEELEQQIKELEEKSLRDKAEMINYRKRKDEEMSRILKYSNEDIVKQILPVVDNFERAIKMDDQNLDDQVSKFLEGFKMIYCNLVSILEGFEVKAIDGANKPFDPTYHEAVLTEKVEGVEPGMVIEVLQKGYLLKDKVIRPAMVKVSE